MTSEYKVLRVIEGATHLDVNSDDVKLNTLEELNEASGREVDVEDTVDVLNAQAEILENIGCIMPRRLSGWLGRSNMKISKLMHERYISGGLGVLPLSKVEGRQTGRSLGLAYYYIGQAMTNPDTPIRIRGYWKSRDSDNMLRKVVQHLITQGGLEFFSTRVSDNTLTYNPFVTQEQMYVASRETVEGKILTGQKRYIRTLLGGVKVQVEVGDYTPHYSKELGHYDVLINLEWVNAKNEHLDILERMDAR